MSLSIGIVGLPNVGKSTLFNALTEKSVDAENYPFCTIDPSVGIVAVPDERLARLTALSGSAETIPAAVEFVDIAGLVKGAHEGEGLGNQFLSHIREVDAIAQMVRIFEDDEIVHVEGTVDPMRDIEVIGLELVLSDMQTVTKRLASVSREARGGDKQAIAEHMVLEKLLPALEAGKPASRAGLSDDETATIKHLHLLSAKPLLYVFNKKSDGHNLDEHEEDERWVALKTFLDETHVAHVFVDAGIESELSGMQIEEKEQFRHELGGRDGGVDALIRAGYSLLDLISFFTTGEKETRSWTITRGSSAPEAGAAIHSDFHDNFIRAEIVAYDDLIAAGSKAAAREAGAVRTEGKEYVVKDGDVIEFRI